jgi:hypothetical protein
MNDEESTGEDLEAVQIGGYDLEADVETSTTLDDGWIEYFASAEIPDNVHGIDPSLGEPEPGGQGDTAYV